MAKERRAPQRWTPESEPAQERFRLLLLALRDELQGARGWQRRVAERLNMVPDHVSRVIARERRVSLEMMQKVAMHLGISTDYFFVGLNDPRGYRDFRPSPIRVGVAQQRVEWGETPEPGIPVGTIADRVLSTLATDRPDFAAAVRLARLIDAHEAVQDAARLTKIELRGGELDPTKLSPEALDLLRARAARVALFAVRVFGREHSVPDAP